MAQEKYLVVVDPAHSEHLALNRIVNFAGRKRHSGMSVQVFVGFEGEDLSAPDQPMEVIQGRGWLDETLVPLEESGVNFVAEVIWTRDWETSIINAARRTQANMIVISRSSAITRKRITDSFWSLLWNS
jgi:hypothetical protein